MTGKEQKMEHGSYFESGEKLREIVNGILEDKKELLRMLKESGD